MTAELDTIKKVFSSFEETAVNLSARIAEKAPYDAAVQQHQKDTGTAFLQLLGDTLPANIAKVLGSNTLPWALKMGALQSTHSAVASRCDDMLDNYFGYRATALGRRQLSIQDDNIRKSLCTIWKQAIQPLQPPKTAQQKFVDFMNWSGNILKKDATVTEDMKKAITALVERFNEAVDSHQDISEAVDADIPGTTEDENVDHEALAEL